MDERRHGRAGRSPDARAARATRRLPLVRARASLARGSAVVSGSDAQASCPAPGRGTAASAQTLAIACERHGTRLHVIVSGTLDVTTAERLRAVCARPCPGDIDVILLDVAHVSSMDGSGLEVLFAAYRHLGERLAVIIGPPCAHLIHVTGSRSRLPIIEG